MDKLQIQIQNDSDSENESLANSLPLATLVCLERLRRNLKDLNDSGVASEQGSVMMECNQPIDVSQHRELQNNSSFIDNDTLDNDNSKFLSFLDRATHLESVDENFVNFKMPKEESQKSPQDSSCNNKANDTVQYPNIESNLVTVVAKDGEDSSTKSNPDISDNIENNSTSLHNFDNYQLINESEVDNYDDLSCFNDLELLANSAFYHNTFDNNSKMESDTKMNIICNASVCPNNSLSNTNCGDIKEESVTDQASSHFKSDCENTLNECHNDITSEECDTDSTIIYGFDGNDEKRDKRKRKSLNRDCNVLNPHLPSDSRCFSPLPSTSRDNLTIDINDARFNEANGIVNNGPNPHSPNASSGKEIDNKKPQSPVIIECSSDSDNDVILLNRDSDDKTHDSDCEIVDVDTIVAQNNAILRKMYAEDIIEVNYISEPKIDSHMAASEPAEVENVTPLENSNQYPSINYQSTLDRMASIVKSFFSRSDDMITNMRLTNSNASAELDSIPIDLPEVLDLRRSRRGKSLREKPPRNKRRRVTSSFSFHSVPHRESSDVILIDLDTPVNLSSPQHVRTSIPDVNLSTSGPIPTISIPDINLSTPGPVPTMSIPVVNLSTPQPVQIMSTPIDNMVASVEVEKPPSVSPEQRSLYEKTPVSQFGECPVCLESIAKTQAVSTFCGHVFCMPCITKSKAISKKCPTCRKTLKGKGFHPIFL